MFGVDFFSAVDHAITDVPAIPFYFHSVKFQVNSEARSLGGVKSCLLAKCAVLPPVSYTHLDVYKRQ